MSEILNDLTRHFETVVVETCDRIFTEGIRRMVRDIEGADLVLSGELKKSLYSERAYVTDQLEASFRMGMRGHGRFKDMRQISYAKFPNVEALKEFVEEIGVDSFINNETVQINGKPVQLYVPGYFTNVKRKSEITAERAKTRIAYGMARAMQERNTIKRRGNSFYNVNKGEIYNEICTYLMTKLPPTMLEAMKEYYERPFYEKDL